MLIAMRDSDEPHYCKEMAEINLEESAKQGYVPALNLYGRILLDNEKWEEAADCFRQTASQGDLTGIHCLAYCHYHKCLENVSDKEKSEELYLQAANAGYADSQLVLAHEYGHINGGCYINATSFDKAYPYPQDNEKSAFWYQKAAEQGCLQAQEELYSLYSTGRIVEKNEQKAEKWLREVANRDVSWAQYKLAQLLEKNSPEDAMIWYSKAAEQGYDDARLYLADYYYAQKQYAEASIWYGKSSDVRAFFMLAEMYENGLGFKKSPKTAAEYYERAYRGCWGLLHVDESMEKESAYRLARYYEGITFPFSKKKLAEEWYRKAAEAGHEGAQHWLEAKQKNT